MRVIIFRTLFSIISVFITVLGACQTTPSALGDSLFTIFKTNAISQLDKFIPSADQTLQIAKSFTPAQNLSESDIQAFREKYPEQKNMFKEKCLEIINEGKAQGLDWQNAQIKEIRTIPIPVGLSEQQKDTAIELKGISVLFSSGNKRFLLTLQIAVALEGKWYIGDNKIDLALLK